ncbi:hypothetical protein GCM10027422_13940 [Hymenobacter arcticus]
MKKNFALTALFCLTLIVSKAENNKNLVITKKPNLIYRFTQCGADTYLYAHDYIEYGQGLRALRAYYCN